MLWGYVGAALAAIIAAKAAPTEIMIRPILIMVPHVLNAIEVFKRFGRGCKPRPASL